MITGHQYREHNLLLKYLGHMALRHRDWVATSHFVGVAALLTLVLRNFSQFAHQNLGLGESTKITLMCEEARPFQSIGWV